MLTRRQFVAVPAVAALSIGLSSRARAQTAGKAVRMIVGFPPGGSSDVVARLLIEQMRSYAPTIIVDNRPGAGGRIAMDVVKAGAPDGSIMVLTPASMMVLYPHLYKTLSYDPLQDFVAVTTVCAFPFVVSVGPMVPRDVKTLADFIGWCRANPKQASYNTNGTSRGHIAVRRLFRVGPAPTDEIGERLDITRHHRTDADDKGKRTHGGDSDESCSGS